MLVLTKKPLLNENTNIYINLSTILYFNLKCDEYYYFLISISISVTNMRQCSKYVVPNT